MEEPMLRSGSRGDGYTPITITQGPEWQEPEPEPGLQPEPEPEPEPEPQLTPEERAQQKHDDMLGTAKKMYYLGFAGLCAVCPCKRGPR